MKKLTILLFALSVTCQINAVDLNKDLFKAIKKGNIEQVKQLIDQGADVNSRNKKGFSPLHIAVASNSLKIIELLTAHGADIFYQCEACSNVTLLGIASFNHAYAAAEYLLDKGVDVNGAAGQKETPLISATLEDDTKMMKILMEHGADVNRLDNDGQNALWYLNSKSAFDLLYHAGINLHHINDEGYSALIGLWYKKFEGINEVLCTLFYEGVVFYEPGKSHHIYYNTKFGRPVGFDSLILLDQVDLILGVRHTLRDAPPVKSTVNDTLTYLLNENIYHFGINGGNIDDFTMEENEDVLSICISRFAKNEDKYNGIANNYFSPLVLEKENAWAHIKHNGDNYYAILNKKAGYILIDDRHCCRVKFFNLLLEDPDSGKKLRIYGENTCMDED